MKKKELCYIVIVAMLGVSLLLSFAVEVFHLDLGCFSWTVGWVSSPIALAIGFAFALLLGKAFPDFNKTMSKKMLQYSVIGLGFGMNVDKALASGAEGMMFTIASVFGTLALGWLLGRKLLGVDTQTSYLLSTGTAICGGSAIAAIGPIIRAKAESMSVALGVITLYMIYKWVPDVEALPNKGMKAQFRFMRHLAPWLIIAATFLGNGGILCWFSYISPLLQIDGGFHAASISVLMILAGLGMVVGNQVSALLADRFKPGRFTCYLQFLAAAALLATFFLSHIGWVSAAMMFISCACLFGIGSPEQFLIVKHSEGGEMLGGCCIQAAFNLGNALGAFLGGIPVAMGLGYNYPALIGVPMALAGAFCLLVFHRKYECSKD